MSTWYRHPSASVEDRRLFGRIPVNFPIKLRGSFQEGVAQVWGKDIGAGGLGVFTSGKLLPKTNLEIWLEIPDGHEALRAMGKVLWSKRVKSNSWISGINFKDVNIMGLSRVFRVPQ